MMNPQQEPSIDPLDFEEAQLKARLEQIQNERSKRQSQHTDITGNAQLQGPFCVPNSSFQDGRRRGSITGPRPDMAFGSPRSGGGHLAVSLRVLI